jgi:hypothetical protein
VQGFLSTPLEKETNQQNSSAILLYTLSGKQGAPEADELASEAAILIWQKNAS